jgi:hypothetical protein
MKWNISAAVLVAGVLVLAGGAFAQQGMSLFSDSEADALRQPDAAWDAPHTRGLEPARGLGNARGLIGGGPDIVFDLPVPDNPEGDAITLHAPADLEITFKDRSAPVDMGSLEISAEKGIFSLSLTNRLRPYIKGNRVVARKLDIPKGNFLIVISVSDQQGNKSSAFMADLESYFFVVEVD